jgi:hypothetical protein
MERNKPDANDDPGKYYPPPDDPAGGGAPGAIKDPVGMVRCRSCGMHTPADEARCERCNSPVR